MILCVKGGYKWSWSLAALEPGGIPPAWHWSPGWCTQGPSGLRPRPTDTAAASPFEGSTSSKAECVSQRHTHTNSEDTWRMLTRLVTRAAMQTALPWTAPLCNTIRTRRRCKHKQPSTLPPLQLVRIEVHWWKHTHNTVVSQAHTLLQIPRYLCGPSVCPVPLPVHWALLPATLGGSPPNLLAQLGGC